MSLYWPLDPADVVTDAPRLHVIVVGVGDYPHLRGGNDTRTHILSGLRQLTTTPATARRIARWFAEEHRNPECELGSVEVLLSDAAGPTIERPDGPPIDAEAATADNIEAAVRRWYARCDGHADSTAAFYFAGHGVASGTSQLLLAADVGADALDPWAGTIDFDAFRTGMRKNRANAQIFFVDACHEHDLDMRLQDGIQGRTLVGSATIEDLVGTQCTFGAAAVGRRAFGPPDAPTYFSQALLDALSGVGATAPGDAVWVDTDSLSSTLGPLLDELGDGLDAPLSSRHGYERLRPCVLHRPASRLVRTRVACESERAQAGVGLKLSRRDTEHVSPPTAERPWVKLLPPGDWVVEATFANGAPVVRDETLSPPVKRILL